MLRGAHVSLSSPPLPSPPVRSRLPNPARGLGERCKLPQRGLGRSPSRNRLWCIFSLKIRHLVATILRIFVRVNWTYPPHPVQKVIGSGGIAGRPQLRLGGAWAPSSPPLVAPLLTIIMITRVGPLIPLMAGTHKSSPNITSSMAANHKGAEFMGNKLTDNQKKLYMSILYRLMPICANTSG